MPDGDPLAAPPPGVLDGLSPAAGLPGELVPGWAAGLADGFLPPRVAPGLVAPCDVAVPGATAPPAGAEVRGAPDALRAALWPGVGAPVVADPAGSWFAAGEPLNAPEASSATRPALAATAAPAASAPARRRWLRWSL